MRDVGVVMPVYEQKSAYLKAAIRSILGQTYKRFKLVIVIDGASSKVEQVVRREVKGDARVRVIVKRKNQGVAKALNRGFKSLLRRKDIRYLTWVSSDNVYYPNYLSTLRRGIRHTSSRLGLVYSSFRQIDENGKPLYSDAQTAAHLNWQNQPKDNLLDDCFVGVSFMYKRRFAQLTGEYELEPVEDYDFWLRLTEHCEMKFLPTFLMDYRANAPYSISRQLASSKDQQRRWRHAFQLAKYQARRRRGITPETTIVVPVANGSNESVQRVESVFDQYHSNFKVLVMDMSPNGEATSALAGISDPRAAFLSVPGMDELSASRVGARNAETPYTLVYGSQTSFDAYGLQSLLSVISGTGYDVMSAYHDASDGTMQFKLNSSAVEPMQGQLYRTAHLVNLF
jgi:glycosyltransferase involved in cell wall biosynthesis